MTLSARQFCHILASAILLAYLLSWTALLLPSAAAALAAPIQSSVTLAALWVVKDQAAEQTAHRVLRALYLSPLMTFGLLIVGAATFFAPVLSIKCGEAGRIAVRFGTASTEVTCLPGTVETVVHLGWRPLARVLDLSTNERTERVLLPHDANLIAYAGDLRRPDAILVRLAKETADLAVPSRLPPAHRGCVNAQSHCLRLASGVEVPLVREGVFVGAGSVPAELLGALRTEIKDASAQPLLVENEPVEANHLFALTVLKRSETGFTPCGTAGFTPEKGNRNTWILEPAAYCSPP
ncbi:MAG TPA: hypothetical protein VFH68_17010 [Polyangia bacterium]|jgi:hypothetical protein|nr:hypothetical protein [Polyangia bacterium]